MRPQNPIAAVIHANPYPYYADLVVRKPIYRDDALGLWVASSAEAVTAVLRSDICRVRPPTEPVPPVLLGSPAADIFRHLIRMNDGPGHCPFNQAVAATLASIDAAEVAARSRELARRLAAEMNLTTYPAHVTDFSFRLSVDVIGGLLGIPENKLAQTASLMSNFVRCIAPGSAPEQIECGKLAASDLLEMFRSLLGTPSAHGLLFTLASEAKRVGRDDTRVVIANAIGFLSQSYEATAGLIGNTLLALAAHSDVRKHVVADPTILGHVVDEVLRYDPPTHNTRRFLAADGVVAGQQMKQGEAILVVVAAANRDATANPDPDRFDIFRKDRRIFTFGAGIHACPGAALATTIAQAGVAHVIASGVDPVRLAETVTYRVAANTRIPLFGTNEH